MCLLRLLVHFGARHCLTPEVADFCRTPVSLLDLMHHMPSTSELSASKDSFNIWKYIHEWTWSPELLKLQLEICSTSFWFSRQLSCTLTVSKSNSQVVGSIHWFWPKHRTVQILQGEDWSQFDSEAYFLCIGLAGTLVIWTRQAPWLTARLEPRFLAQRRNGFGSCFGSSSVALILNKILLTACASNTSKDHVLIIDDVCQHMLSAAWQESCGCGGMHLMCNSIHVKEPRMLIGEYPFEDQWVVSCMGRIHLYPI